MRHTNRDQETIVLANQLWNRQRLSGTNALQSIAQHTLGPIGGRTSLFIAGLHSS
jgi:hypothetical protein